jgi:hypothetical protein
MPAKVLAATTLALLIGTSVFSLDTAAAQNGGEARGNDRTMQKKLDDRDLTPIRPIRRVGPDSWPAAKNPQPTNMPRETTGQAAKNSHAQDSAKQDTAQQQPAKPEDKTKSASQESRQQPAPKQDAAKSDNANRESAAPQQAAKDKDTADNKQQPPEDRQQNAKQDNDQQKDLASVRLGTDAKGRVAVNDAQQRQIEKALRKHPVKTFDVDVRVGAAAPAEVRLGAVSADIVEVLPQFRGYSYFATRDEIAIVEPNSRRVVAMVPVKVTAVAAKPREEPTTRAETRRKTVQRDVTVGQGVPSIAEIEAAPVVTVPAQTTVRRTYRVEEPAQTVIIERRRPRVFGLW